MEVHGSTDSIYAAYGTKVYVIANPNVTHAKMSILYADKFLI